MSEPPPDVPSPAVPDSPMGPPPDPSAPILRVRGPRASSVIVQRLPVDQGGAFMEWQHGITGAAGAFPGYQATEIYPPAGDRDEWVIIVHFDDQQTLQAWLDAPERAAWLAELPHEARDFRLHTMPTGFGSWVAGQTADGTPVPHWKSFLLVLAGLYPVVMLLTLIVSPRTAGLGLALAMLVSNILSVALLEWAVMPLLNRVLAPWLGAHGRDGRLVSTAGGAFIVAAVLVMALLLRVVGAS